MPVRIKTPAEIFKPTGIFKPIDPIDRFTKVLSLVALAEKVRSLPAQRKAAANKAKKDAQELKNLATTGRLKDAQLQEANAKLGSDGITKAINGDVEGGSLIWNFYKPGHSLKLHPNVQKRMNGIVLDVDSQTGVETEIDPFVFSGLQKEEELKFDLYKKAGEQAIDDKSDRLKAIQKNAIAFSRDRGIDPQQSLKIAKAIDFQAWGTTPGGKQAKDAPVFMVPANQMTDDALRQRARAVSELQTARIAGIDLSKISLRKLRDVPATENAKLLALKQVNNNYGKIMLPLLIDLAENPALATNLATANTNALLQQIGAGSERFTALSTTFGKTFMEQLRAQSGVQYSAKEMEKIQKMLPQPTDTVGVNMAKISALMAMNSMNAAEALDFLDDAGHFIGNMRHAFTGQEIFRPGDDLGNAAAILMDSIPPEIRANKARMGQFLNNLSPLLGDEVAVQLSGEAPNSVSLRRMRRKAVKGTGSRNNKQKPEPPPGGKFFDGLSSGFNKVFMGNR